MEEFVINLFNSLTYQPILVYIAVALIMLASSFGFPIPEEVTLVTSGLLAYMGSRPDLYPPPQANMNGVNIYILAVVSLLSVVISDSLVFFLGKKFGFKLKQSSRFQRIIPSSIMDKVERWTNKHGAIMAGVFRFTPGLRFPGHMACGMFGIPYWKFIASDGGAALISVPTQVLLVGFYGQVILDKIKQFKKLVLIVGSILFLIYVVKKLISWRVALLRTKKNNN